MLWDIKQGGDVYNQLGQWLTHDNRSSLIDQAEADSAKNTRIITKVFIIQ